MEQLPAPSTASTSEPIQDYRFSVVKVNGTTFCQVHFNGPTIDIFRPGKTQFYVYDHSYNVNDIVAVDNSCRRQLKLKIAFRPAQEPRQGRIAKNLRPNGIYVVTFKVVFKALYSKLLEMLFDAEVFTPIYRSDDMIEELRLYKNYYKLKQLPTVRAFMRDANLTVAMLEGWSG